MDLSVSDMHDSRVQPGVSGGAAQWAPVAQVLNTALAEQRLVGAVVLVYQHGVALCRMAAGWADREARIAMAEDTVFRWASVSKPVVSAAVMRLASPSFTGPGEGPGGGLGGRGAVCADHLQAL